MRSAFLTALLTCLTCAFLSHANAQQAAINPMYQSAQAHQRIEYWQQRQITIDEQLRDVAMLKKVKLLFIGDSITDFWQMDEDVWVANQWHGKTVWDAHFAGVPAQNFAFNIGISGDRTEHILYRLLPRNLGGLGHIDPPELAPQYAIIMLGINNSWAPEKPVVDSIVAGVKAVVLQVQKLKPHTRIILQSILPTNDPTKNAQVVTAVNQQLASWADKTRHPELAKNLVYLDLYTSFVDSDDKQIARYFVQDGLHPSRAGYQVWSEQLLPFIEADRALLVSEK